ncbi:MAG: glycosyltransferase [Propionibacteriaceae bacterium]|nr:glycosyltransferase [Propionibacteriaceae bacterium]
MRKKKILFLFSDTGGGHRAPTNAMIQALEAEYPGQYDTQMIDFLRYLPAPFKNSPELYPSLSRMKAIWKVSYESMNGPVRSRAATQIAYPYVRKAITRLLDDNPADMIVSVHPLSNAMIPRVLKKNPIPFITMVTDLVSTHVFWYSTRSDMIIVPTVQAKNRGIRLGIPAQRMQVVGLPVSQTFNAVTESKEDIKKQLGWDGLTVLLVGGGDGMGPVRKVARAINDSGLPISLAVVCGRNESLLEDLHSLNWKIPHHLYGFVSDMPQYMTAADIFVTKAGANSVSEAFICGLPTIIYSYLPGQEVGNVDYVLDGGAGTYAATPTQVVEDIRTLVDDDAAREKMAAASLALARPDASRDIVRLLAQQLS